MVVVVPKFTYGYGGGGGGGGGGGELVMVTVMATVVTIITIIINHKWILQMHWKLRVRIIYTENKDLSKC